MITIEKVRIIAEEVEDVTEETFILFSKDIPSNNLGILDERASTINVEAAGREYEIRQSPGLLTSNRDGGTTGAVLWKVTPLLTDWMADPKCCFWQYDILTSSTTIVELGCGVAGLIGLSVGNLVQRYILTDQDYVMKILKENINSNKPSSTNKKGLTNSKHTKRSDHKNENNLSLVELDWENDSVQTLTQTLNKDERIDLVLLCDCVYNEYLIRPLIETCVGICALNPSQTILMIAQQLRTDEIFHLWMERLSESFTIWRVSDKYLSKGLKTGSGYVLHLAMLTAGIPDQA